MPHNTTPISAVAIFFGELEKTCGICGSIFTAFAVSHDWYKDGILLELSQIVVEGKIRMSGQSWSWVEVDVLKSCLWSNHHQYLKVRKNYFEHFNELLVNCVCCWVEEDDPRQLAKKGDNCKFLWSVCNSHLKSCLLLRYPGHATWRKYSGVSDQHSESSCSWRKY